MEETMSRQLVDIISDKVDVSLHNVATMIKTCEMDYVLFDAPISKNVYHMLHSLDKWFVNPSRFREPPIHEMDLDNIDIKSEGVLSREMLFEYFEGICDKIRGYISTLDDSMLGEKPDGCEYTRLGLILGQFRHLHSHMGNINATTMIVKNKWPRVVGLTGEISGELYE
jgi:hypothetical protein